MKKKLIITTIFVSIFIAAINVHETYASQYSDCINAAGSYASIESIKQACTEYSNHGTNSSWGAVWYSSTENGQEDIKITSLDSNSQTIYLSGAVYNGKNVSKERYYEGSGDANYKGLFWGNIEDSICKLFNEDGTNFNIDCDSLILSGSFNHTDIYRGRLTGKNQWSVVGGEEGEAKPIELNLAAIKTLILNKGWAASDLSKLEITNSRSIWWAIEENDDGSFYASEGNIITTSSSPIYFDISDTSTVSSQVRGKRSSETNYSTWAGSYSNTFTNGSPDSTTLWDIEFQHIITINDTTTYTIDKDNNNCPTALGYSCSFGTNSAHVYSPGLTHAGSITKTEILTLTKPDGSTLTSSATAQVSKTTTNTESGNTDGSELSNTIIYTAECSPSESDTVEISLEDSSKTIYYYLESQSHTDYSSLPEAVQTEIRNKEPNEYLNANPYPGYDTLDNIMPGETRTSTYSEYNKLEITYSYKMRQDTKTTTTVDEDGNESSETVAVGDPYPTDINITGPFTGSQIICEETDVYRPTKFYEYDTSGNGAKNELTGNTYWGSGSTEAKAQISVTPESEYSAPTNISSEATGDTGKLYAHSSENNPIKLKYDLTNNYHFNSGTVTSRLSTLTVEWWKKGSSLEFDPDQITNGTKTESTQINVENVSTGDPNTGSDTELTLGTYNKEICEEAKTINSQIVHYNTEYLNDDSYGTLIAKTCAHLYRPWNYNLSFTSIESTSNKGMLYLNNQTTTVTANLENNNNIYSDSAQEGNPSYSPETTFTLYQVTISDSDLTGVTNISNYIQNLELDIKNGTRTGISVGSPQTKTFDPESSNNTIEFGNITFNQAGIGDHICLYATANRTNSYDDTTGRPGSDPTYYGTPKTTNILHSGLTCFTVAGFPTFQVRGGSILTEGNAKAKVVESNGEYFGSWIDYGLATKGDIKQLSSGKAFIGTEEYTYPKNHPLTIANNAQNGNEPKGQSNISASATKKRLKSLYAPGAKTALEDGKFTNNHTYDIEVSISNSTNYATYTSNQFTTPTSDTNAKYRYTYINKPDNDTVIKQGSDLPKGVTHVIYSTGNIVIGSDFTYSSSESYNQISDIPQYVIISEKNIYIDQDVKEIHAWLIADGEINTCTGYEKWEYPENMSNALHKQDGGKGYNSATYTKDICNTALKISGPIFANNIWLERTSISGVTGVSETVNLTAENYYWALAKAKESNKISTAYTRSLAPRY